MNIVLITPRPQDRSQRSSMQYTRAILLIFTLTNPHILKRCQTSQYRPTNPWKMRVITICDDEREEIVTFVSTYGLKAIQIKGNEDQMK